MPRFLVSVFLVVLALGVTGCASIVSLANEDGLDQKISFNSDPSGAKLFLNGTKPLGETPFARKIERSENAFVIAKKEGYEDQQIQLTHHFNHWFWGNILLGGLIGSTIDYADDAVIQLDPTTYYITMTPKQVSLEQQQHHEVIRRVRNLLMVGYPNIQGELARGEGEYLTSVLTALNVQNHEREQALGRLKKASEESIGAPDFAERILRDFNRTQLSSKAY